MANSTIQLWRNLFEAKPEGTYFTPPDLAEMYNFPKATGKGQSIAIIALGGGFHQVYLDQYFERVIGISSPKISINDKYAPNQPHYDFKSNMWKTLTTAELYSDIEIAGSIASEAEIVVYFAPREAAGLLAALRTAVQDKKHKNSVISISWSRREGDWLFKNKYYLDPFNEIFEEARKKNITICASSGDKGSIEEQVGGPDTWFPSSHPLVLGCGGTKLPGKEDLNRIETVWNEQYEGPGPFHDFYFATGGGFSEEYPRPKWQEKMLQEWPDFNTPTRKEKRGVPDISAHAAANNGYYVHFGPTPFYWAGGTSCSTPLWAALIALINEKLGTNVGFVNPHLYEIAESADYLKAFHDITLGDNSLSHTIGYQAGRYWDPCTGLGSPNGKGLLQALQRLPSFQKKPPGKKKK